jgi:site-specific recombinase XerD
MNTRRRGQNNSTPDNLLRLLATRLIGDTKVLDELIIQKGLGEAINYWLRDLDIAERSKATLRFYRQNLEPFREFVEAGGPVDLKSVGVEDIRSFLLSYQNGSAKRSAFAIDAKYRTLRAFWNWAIKEGYALDNPVESLKAPRLPRKIIPTFSPEDIKRMLATCDTNRFLGLRDRAMILVLYDTGVRVGELVGMRVADLDIESRLLRVTGKGNKMRTVHISNNTLRALWAYLKKFRGEPATTLWLSEERRPLTDDGVRQAVRRIAKRAGITSGVRASPHTFRHTFAIEFLRAGGNVFDLQTLGGWESLDMVKRYAQTLNIDDALKAHERFSPVDKLTGGAHGRYG